MKNRYVISLFTITDLCLLYIGISSVFPIVNGYLGNIDIAISIGLNIFLLCVAIAKNSKCFKNGRDIILLAIVLVYTVLLPYLFENSVIANRYLGMLIFLVGPHIFMLYKQSGEIKRLKKISIIICIFAGITLIITASGLLTNPYLARSIKSSGDITKALKLSGIGGYEFIYFCMLLGVALFYCFWQKKKIVYLLGTIGLFVFLLLSNYITSVFLLALGCLFCLLTGRSMKQRLIAVAVIVLLIIFSELAFNSILNLIMTITPSGRIARFLTASNNSFFQELSKEFMEDRLPTIQASWNSLIDSLGLGVVFSKNIDLTILGQHSFVLDSIAIFGLPIGFAYLYLVFKDLELPGSILISFILLSLFNNMTNSIGIAAYFIIPTLVMEEYQTERIGGLKWIRKESRP